MDGLNRVILLGNIGSDPEARKTTHGTTILSLRLATTETYRERDTKTRKERTEWHKVVVFGQSADNLSKFLAKGDRILVEGKLRTRSYQAKAGHKVYVVEVVSDNILLQGSKKFEEKRNGGRREKEEEKTTSEDEDPFNGADDDDVPF